MLYRLSRLLRPLSMGLALVAIPCLAVVACDDDDPATPSGTADSGTDSGTSSSGGEAGPTAETGTIKGTVTYSGTAKGPLQLAVFKTFPPAPGSLPDKFTVVPNPTFPAQYEIKDAPKGKLTMTAFINQFNSQGSPSPTDPTNIPAAVEVLAGQTVTLDIVLRDKPTDAGADADAAQ